MASIINADTSNGLKLTSDTTGQLDFQSAGSTKATIDTAGNLKFDSGYGSVATAYGCRAWVNFNGTGTVAIRESGNVSSITDNATGDYTINFTTAMPDANYSPTFMLGRDSSNIDVFSAIHPTVLPTTSALRIRTAYLSQVGASTYVDLARINIAVFR